MPAAPTSYPYLSWKYNRIVLRLPKPKAVQHILGKKMFNVVMAQTTMPEAHAASLPILAEWRRQILDAHSASRDHKQAEILRLRTAFEAFDGKPLGAAGGELFGAIMDFLFQTYGGVTVAQQRLALAEAKGNLSLALPAPARQPLALITGMVQPSTPFLAHMEGENGWKARTHLRGKSLDQAVTAVKEFATAVPCDLETLAGGMVQKWIDGQLRPTDGSKPALPDTVRKKLTGLKSYWAWMQDNDKADKERHPFTKRPIRDHRTARERMEAQPKPFDVADVPRLWQQAEADGDRDLFAITKIGAHTGMRREEICALKVEQVRPDPVTGIRYLFEVGDKTVAAIRNVPIPSAIAGLIDELVANATPDGFLVHDGWLDKNGHRGGEVGSRFGDMKTAMGFGPQFQFRSLRKTAIKVMKEQKLVTPPFLLSIIKNLVGHHDADITSGRYAGTSGLADKLEVLETVRYPD